MKSNLKYLPFEEFQEIYSKVPRLCVEVVLRSDEGIMLTKRTINPWKGMWHFPVEQFFLEKV